MPSCSEDRIPPVSLNHVSGSEVCNSGYLTDEEETTLMLSGFCKDGGFKGPSCFGQPVGLSDQLSRPV